MICETELRKRLEVKLETSASAILTPDQMPFARKIVKILVPRVLHIIREEVRAALRADSAAKDLDG